MLKHTMVEGLRSLTLGNIKMLIVDYDKVIQLDPKSSGAYVNRGEAKSNLGQHEPAIVDCDMAIRLDPNNA